MDSPVARVFGIESSVIATSIGYTCTAFTEASVPDFFGECQDRPMTLPMDRSRLLSKLRPTTNGSESPESSSAETSRTNKPTSKPNKGQKKNSFKKGYPASSATAGSQSIPFENSGANASGSDNIDRVAIRLGDFASMMMDAAATNRTWVQDFSDDQVVIPRDLYEVLLAYQRMRKAG